MGCRHLNLLHTMTLLKAFFYCFRFGFNICFIIIVPGLGLICKWAGGDGLPSLSRQSDYVGIDATEKLQCPDPDFPVLTDGAY